MDATLNSGKTDGFRDRVLALLEWVADRDPVAAAKLVVEFGEDLSREVGGRLAGCEDPAACGCGCA